MKNIIASICDALDKEAYLPALALALTIPDVCGQIAYPEITGEGSSKNRYQTWFSEHVAHFYADEKGFTSNGSPRSSFMTGKACYDLRNHLLHGGNADIHVANKELFGKEVSAPKYIYELFVNSANGYGYLVNLCGEEVTESIVQIRVDIGDLCENLCTAAERFGEAEGALYEQHDLHYVDLEARVQQRGYLEADHAGCVGTFKEIPEGIIASEVSGAK